MFTRAIERGDLPMAEMAAREMGHIWLADALKLTVLAIEKAPGKRTPTHCSSCDDCSREDANVTIDETVMAATALAALGGRRHEQAVTAL